MKYFVQLILRKEQQDRKFTELHSEIWILSKSCQTVQILNLENSARFSR